MLYKVKITLEFSFNADCYFNTGRHSTKVDNFKPRAIKRVAKNHMEVNSSPPISPLSNLWNSLFLFVATIFVYQYISFFTSRLSDDVDILVKVTSWIGVPPPLYPIIKGFKLKLIVYLKIKWKTIGNRRSNNNGRGNFIANIQFVERIGLAWSAMKYEVGIGFYCNVYMENCHRELYWVSIPVKRTPAQWACKYSNLTSWMRSLSLFSE